MSLFNAAYYFLNTRASRSNKHKPTETELADLIAQSAASLRSRSKNKSNTPDTAKSKPKSHPNSQLKPRPSLSPDESSRSESQPPKRPAHDWSLTSLSCTLHLEECASCYQHRLSVWKRECQHLQRNMPLICTTVPNGKYGKKSVLQYQTPILPPRPERFRTLFDEGDGDGGRMKGKKRKGKVRSDPTLWHVMYD